MELSTRDWSDALIAKAGLERALFPPGIEPGAVLGHVTAAAARETRAAAGTPFVAGGGDVQLGAVGLGVLAPNEAAIPGGTFWQQIVNIPQGLVDETMCLRVNAAAPTGMNRAEAITFFVGLAAAQGCDAYDLHEELAMQVPPGAHGIIPIFSDAMDFGNWYHAAPSFLNLSINPAITNKGSMFRALQENAAIVAAENLARVADFAGVENDGPPIMAGGASKGRLWPQIVADVTGRRLRIPKVREATALGGAAAAATGLGQFSTLAEAGRALVRWDREVSPDSANRGLYDKARGRWKTAYAAQKRLVDEGVTTAMWRAPGT